MWKRQKIMKMREANQRSLENQTDGLVRSELLVRALHPYEQHYEPARDPTFTTSIDCSQSSIFP